MQQAFSSAEEFRTYLADQFAIDPSELGLDASLDDLGFDSMARVELLAMLELDGVAVDAEMILTSSATLREIHDSALRIGAAQ